MPLSKPTNGSNADYPARVDAVIDVINNGNYPFPATQVPSADANTLDDYEEGTWTAAVTFATVGNLSVAYTSRPANYTKIGEQVRLSFSIVTSTFTHTTASGNLKITGNPFTPATVTDASWVGALGYQGITKASYTSFVAVVYTADTSVYVEASGSAQTKSTVAAADMPTAGSVILNGQLFFKV